MAVNMCLRVGRSYLTNNQLLIQKSLGSNRQMAGTFFSRTRSTEQNSEKKEDPPTNQTETADTGAADSQKAESATNEAQLKLTQENEQLTAQFNEIQDKYKRSLAETENVRNRLKKQADDAKLFGIQGFCKELLEVADTLNKAVESVPEQRASGTSAHFKDLLQGLTMTEQQLQKVFNRNGMYPINPQEGDAFDPNLHEAMFVHSVDGKTTNTVMTVTKIGYKLHDRTLRPALVGVYK